MHVFENHKRESKTVLLRVVAARFGVALMYFDCTFMWQECINKKKKDEWITQHIRPKKKNNKQTNKTKQKQKQKEKTNQALWFNEANYERNELTHWLNSDLL